ncbi:MAG: sulfur carrier protein ThiS, partial [Pseudomonadota bacterium]
LDPARLPAEFDAHVGSGVTVHHPEANLQQIISQFALPEMGCVFAINNNVVPRSEWASTVLSQGDSISLFQAIAGG